MTGATPDGLPTATFQAAEHYHCMLISTHFSAM